jgi:hypothetical protein
MQKKEIRNTFMTFWISDDIIFGRFDEGITWDRDKSIQCVNDRLVLSSGKSYPILLDVRKVKSITKEAREYMSSDIALKDTSAAAVVVDSSVGRVMGNFYFALNKPKLPFRIFNTEEKAIKWLTKFKSQD